MVFELKHDNALIIKQYSVAFSSTVASIKSRLFVKLTFKMSLYHDVGNEYAIIQANRCMSYNPTLTESLYVTSTFYLTITATCQVSDFDCNSRITPSRQRG